MRCRAELPADPPLAESVVSAAAVSLLRRVFPAFCTENSKEIILMSELHARNSA